MEDRDRYFNHESWGQNSKELAVISFLVTVSTNKSFTANDGTPTEQRDAVKMEGSRC